MKSSVRKSIIGSVIFLFLVAAIFAIVQPVYKAVNKTLAEYQEKLSVMLAEKTGLGVSYKSLSPSILTLIKIRGIKIYDVTTKKEILSINSTVVRYNLFKLLKKDFKNAFTYLTVNDVDFFYDSEQFKTISEKIALLFSSEKQDENDSRFIKLKTRNTIKNAVFSIPFDVHVRNVNFSYSNSGSSFNVTVLNALLSKDRSGKVLNGDFSGKAYASFSALNGKKAGFNFKLNCSVKEESDGSSLLITLDDLPSADFSVKNLNLLFHYENSKAQLQSSQHILPYSINANVNIDTGEGEIFLNSENFNPFAVLKLPAGINAVEKIKGSKISGTSFLKINIPEKKYSWNTDSSVFLSRNLVEKGQCISLKAQGDNDFITVSSLDAKGDMASFDFSGTYDIQNMLPQCVLNLEYFKLKNENKISANAYIDSVPGKIELFIPQLFFGTQYYSGLEFALYHKEQNLDFEFKVSDLSHENFENSGVLSLDGSVSLGKEKYVQASCSINNLFLDSIVKTAGFFADSKGSSKITDLAQKFSSVIMTNEIYFSTDFKSVTFNSPYSIFANTEKDRQFILISFDGNQSSVSISQLDFMYGKNSVIAKASAEYSKEDRQFIFSTSMNVNDIPYDFDGIYTLGKWLNVTGSYGLNVNVDFDSGISGTAQFSTLPVSVKDFLFAFSADTSFYWRKGKNFNVEIINFEGEEFSGKISVKPKIKFAGNVNESGLILSSLIYSDTISTLEGSGYGLLNFDSGTFGSLTSEIILSNPFSQESLSLNASVTNPLLQDFSRFREDFYFSAECSINTFPLKRFVQSFESTADFSALLSASGTFENPYLAVNLKELKSQSSNLSVKGNAAFLEGNITLTDFDVTWNNFNFKKMNAQFNLKNFEGQLTSEFTGKVAKREVKAPVNLVITNLSPFQDTFIPESFAVELNCENVSGNLFPQEFPLNVTFVRSPGRFDIMTNEYLGMFGEYLDSGELNFSISESKDIHCNVSGSIKDRIMNIDISNIYIDSSKISFLINTKYFSLWKGIVTGELNLSGLISDPNLEGEAVVSGIQFNFPDYVPEYFTSEEVSVEFSQDEIEIFDTPFKVGTGSLFANCFIALDRWKIGSLEVNVKSNKKKDFPIDVKAPYVRVNGKASLDATLVIENEVIDIQGKGTLNNAEISILTNTGSEYIPKMEKAGKWNVRLAVNVDVGKKVQVLINPLIRGLIAPDTPLEFNLDTSSSLWNMKGDIVLRGGEVSYLSRNFYLKEGRIILNETQNSFDPNITVRAETKEHDENGDPVTISLSAIRQNLSNFNATLSSSPAKSENEIMSILGQIVTGDASSASTILLAGVDYGVQVTVLRKLEGALRDLCNFDIFSLRTTLLQNTIKQGFNMNTESEKGSIISNLFDNSTVYIGKYFGSNIYVDALMHWTFDETKADLSDSVGGGLVFQPEVGLELEAPFANIRWSFAPDLGTLQQSWVQSTSITLSWRLTF